jgi:hypothetical protein
MEVRTPIMLAGLVPRWHAKCCDESSLYLQTCRAQNIQ